MELGRWQLHPSARLKLLRLVWPIVGSLACLYILFISLGQLPAQAAPQARPRLAPIVVNTVASIVSVDGGCGLREALQASYNNTAVNECPAGSPGLDTITFNLPADSTIVLGNYLPVLEPVIIDGSGAPNLTISGNNSTFVFYIANNAPTTINALTIANGFHANDGGGGILSFSALTLTHVNILSNTTNQSGGGVYSEGPVTVIDGRFENNRAGSSGGGLMVIYPSPITITNTIFISNTAQQEGGGIRGSTGTIVGGRFERNRAITHRGGGVALSEVTVTDTEFVSNTAGYGGGGLFAGQVWSTGAYFEHNQATEIGGGLEAIASVLITDTTFISNTSSQGGGLRAFSGVIRDSYFEDNLATRTSGSSGGGLSMGSNLTLHNTRFMSNTSRSGGGGAYVAEVLIATNSHFEGNRASGGGGLQTAVGKIYLTNTHFISNTAQGSGGAIWAGEGGVLDSVELRGNQAQQGGAIFIGDDVLTQSGLVTISHNTATQYGGGLYVSLGSSAVLTNARLLSNSAGIAGGAVYQTGVGPSTSTTIEDSCIVANTDTAVYYDGGTPINATNNWWGSADGPGGAGPGQGDSVSANVNFTGFKGTPLPGCPSLVFFVDVALTKQVAPTLVQPGQPVTYTLTFSNTGNLDATQVVITDFVPADLVNLKVISSGASITSTGTGSTLAWQVQNLAPGQKGIITLTGQINPAAGNKVFTNTAVISAASDSVPANNNSAAAVTVRLPQLTLAKTASTSTPQPGQRITYTIKANNSGSVAAIGAAISDTLAASLTLAGPITIQGSSGIVGAPPLIAKNLTIQPGKSITVIVPVTVGNNVGNGTVITNTAIITVNSGSTLVSSQAAVPVTVVGLPKLALAKKVSTATPQPGQRITYTITVSNTGSAIATGVTISDTLASSLTLAGPISIQGSSGIVGSPPVIARNMTIQPGKLITIIVPVTVNNNVANAAAITNTAAVTSTEIITPTGSTVTVIVKATPQAKTYLPLLLKNQ